MRFVVVIGVVVASCLACKPGKTVSAEAPRSERASDASASNFARIPPLDQEVACTCSSKGLAKVSPTAHEQVPRLYVVERQRGVG